jgi:lysozyme
VTVRGRVAAAVLTLSAAGLIAIAQHEGYRDTAYVPVPGDRPTIGFGAANGVQMGERTDPVRALVRLGQDATEAEQAVQRCANVPMYQHEFDLWVGFTTNVGQSAFCRSTAAAKLRALDYAGACAELLRWVHVQGRVVQGLVNRREQEYRRCMGT